MEDLRTETLCEADRLAEVERVGYDNDAHMARYFVREMGETPRAYRRRHQGQAGTYRGRIEAIAGLREASLN